MMLAAQRGYLDIVRALIPKEAKKVDARGKTACKIASDYSYFEIVNLLKKFE